MVVTSWDSTERHEIYKWAFIFSYTSDKSEVFLKCSLEEFFLKFDQIVFSNEIAVVCCLKDDWMYIYF